MNRGRAVRDAYMIAYSLMVIAGCFIPIQLKYLHGIARPLWWALAIMLALGAGVSLVGQIRRHWTGEWIGLPAVTAAMFSFGLLEGAVVHWSLLVVPSLALLWAISALVFARWRDVHRLYAVQRHMAGVDSRDE